MICSIPITIHCRIAQGSFHRSRVIGEDYGFEVATVAAALHADTCSRKIGRADVYDMKVEYKYMPLEVDRGHITRSMHVFRIGDRSKSSRNAGSSSFVWISRISTSRFKHFQAGQGMVLFHFRT